MEIIQADGNIPDPDILQEQQLPLQTGSAIPVISCHDSNIQFRLFCITAWTGSFWEFTNRKSRFYVAITIVRVEISLEEEMWTKVQKSLMSMTASTTYAYADNIVQREVRPQNISVKRKRV